MTDVDAINVVCYRIADKPRPATASTAERCACCTEPVWLAKLTIAAIERMGLRADARVVCQPCAKPGLAVAIAVLTHDGISTAAAGEVAGMIGVPAGTPVINVDRMPRA